MTTFPMRAPWQGVRQIFQFNHRFYLTTGAGVCVALAALPFLPSAMRALVLLAVVPAIYWWFASLTVSHYIYDLYPLYDLHWIAGVLGCTPRRWINFHSGLDETSEVLHAVFPQTERRIADIFDPRVMTEPSIHEARKRRANAEPAEHVRLERVRFDALPFPDESFDAAFAFFAAHELRRPAERVRFFREVARILAPGRAFVVMEHTRDWRNFLAFGPGFLHFFSRRAWRRAAAEAGFAIASEHMETAFVRAYVLRRLP
jgi:SAM-dependent methyltransferase